MLFEKFYPNDYYESSYSIDYKKFYEDGYRGIIYDIDNTLVPHGAPADERALELMKELREIGFDVTFLSNNKEPRVKMFNEKINAKYIYSAGKPKASGYLKAAENMNCAPDKALFIGDQLFTDVWGANNAHIRSILVQPIDKSTDEIQIVLKRILERIVLRKYLKNHKILSKEQE